MSNKTKPLTPFEIRYMNKLHDTYGLNGEIAQEIMQYNREINNGLIHYWFLDRLAEYIVNRNPQSPVSARALIDTFHEKYVASFGRS